VVSAVVGAACTVVACGGSSSDDPQSGGQDLSANGAIASAMESDVHQHASQHIVTKLDDALVALTSDSSAQAAVKKGISDNVPDGAGGPFFGNITVSGVKYLWADYETDEGEGPTASGQTQVFDVTGKKVLFRSWTGTHDY
jgi:hypothetical protein